jgi:hypothetical protein
VYIVLRDFGYIKIDDMRYFGDINSPGNNIGGYNKDVNPFVKLLNGIEPVVLFLV